MGKKAKHYRAIFISDVHLGTRDSNADALLKFIKDYDSDFLFLVGDIIDGWSLKRRWIWKQQHSDVIQKILRKARKGTQVYYILGNHDEFIRPFLPVALGDNIEIRNEFEYPSADGKRYLVIHGDFCDPITLTHKWLAIVGDVGYQWLLQLNRPINWTRRRIGFKRHWSLSKMVKDNVKQAVSFINNYEEILSHEAKLKECDGVICGHIHKPEIKDIDGVAYLNCGDWVESCSAILETVDGQWEMLEHFGLHVEDKQEQGLDD